MRLSSIELTGDKVESFKKEADKWIITYGSVHLNKCLYYKVDCYHAYITERLKKERPGWKLHLKPYGICTYFIAANPPLEALDLLEQAKEQCPNAILEYYSTTFFDGLGGYSNINYVAESSFLGLPIFYERLRKKFLGFNYSKRVWS